MFSPEVIKRSLIRAALVTIVVMGYLLLTDEEKPPAQTGTVGAVTKER